MKPQQKVEREKSQPNLYGILPTVSVCQWNLLVSQSLTYSDFMQQISKSSKYFFLYKRRIKFQP